MSQTSKVSPQDLTVAYKNLFLNSVHLHPTLGLRNRHLFLLDVFALFIIPTLAMDLRLDRLDWWPEFGRALVLFTAVALFVKLPIFYYLGLYSRYWRYASINDLTRVVFAVVTSTTGLTILFVTAQAGLGYYDLALPRTIPLIDGMLTGLVIGGFRLGQRWLHYEYRQNKTGIGGRRVLIAGAGEAGLMVAQEMQTNSQLEMEPVAFVDDDPLKIGTYIQTLPVLGPCEDIPDIVEQYHIQRIVVAIPSAPLGRLRHIIEICEQTGVTTDSLPGIYEILAGYKTISRLPRLDINHLLHRKPVEIDQTEVAASLKGAVVLVTGAGGSIGSELCRQIARFDPAEIILVGHGENSIFEIGLDLRISFENLVIHQVIVDVRDREGVDRVINRYRPAVIFHAAAHKHVPFMETDVREAITNNILGTHNVLRAAEKYDVSRFVLISTDKAVNPTSIMGATKRMAELLVITAAQRSGNAYMAVRFGNVLGSRGSVIPIFLKQIANGGPLTVTDPNMCRYFMTIPEAVQLVLQASVLGKGSEIFVLDMGQPVRILDLATSLVKLSGLEIGRDIEIVYSGIRPGEKLSEELFISGENYRRTKHPKIFVATNENTVKVEILEQIALEVVFFSERMTGEIKNEQLHTLLPKICYYIDKYQPQRPQPTITPEPSSSGSLYTLPSTLIV